MGKFLGMRFMKQLAVLLFSFLYCQSPDLYAKIKSWNYSRAEPTGANAPEKGRMTVLTLSGESFVPAKQFCGSLGCILTYQWDKHRLMIENPRTHRLAIVSSLASVAIVEGIVQEIGAPILVTGDHGYLLPVEFASLLALKLGLGSLTPDFSANEDVISLPEPKALKRVVIDAGHGGYDLGTSQGSLYEKDVSLFYAIKLREEIKNKIKNIKVELTREDDRFVSLAERARFANEKDASLFISLHVNHSDDRSAHGTETYILSPDATDSDSRKTSLLENESWVQNTKVGELPTSEGIKKIFVDLEQQKFIQDSAVFASYAQQEFSRIKATKNRGVKQAFFYVLSQAAMPSVLIEIGFLSNQSDREKIMNHEFQNKFIDSMITAIIRYKARLEHTTR
jgi:N-acetylmuramoyl-L-alanine amidase